MLTNWLMIGHIWECWKFWKKIYFNLRYTILDPLLVLVLFILNLWLFHWNIIVTSYFYESQLSFTSSHCLWGPTDQDWCFPLYLCSLYHVHRPTWSQISDKISKCCVWINLLNWTVSIFDMIISPCFRHAHSFSSWLRMHVGSGKIHWGDIEQYFRADWNCALLLRF